MTRLNCYLGQIRGRNSRPSIVRSNTALGLILFVYILGTVLTQADSFNVIGTWKVEVTFTSGPKRSLRFEAKASGQASLVALVPEPLRVGPAEPSPAQWTQDASQSVTFSGPVQFPLGNVGIERGTLLLKGKPGADGSISGEAKFFPVDQDPKDPKVEPLKSGTFKAVRLTNNKL